MKTVSLNAELLRQLSYIADDELYLRKALNSIKRLVAQKEKEEEMACVAEAAEEYRPQTKAEPCFIKNLKLMKVFTLVQVCILKLN